MRTLGTGVVSCGAGSINIFPNYMGKPDHPTKRSGLDVTSQGQRGRHSSHTAALWGAGAQGPRTASSAWLPPALESSPHGFLASTPAEPPSAAAAAYGRARESARLRSGGAPSQPGPRLSQPHRPRRKRGSLRLLISIRLKAGIPAKVSAASGRHDLALPGERGGNRCITGHRGNALGGG